MRHYLGAALLKAAQPAAAEAVYRRDLRWNQNNGWAFGSGNRPRQVVRGRANLQNGKKNTYLRRCRVDGVAFNQSAVADIRTEAAYTSGAVSLADQLSPCLLYVMSYLMSSTKTHVLSSVNAARAI